jgi:hypothetical protein
MKTALPENAKIAKEAKECMQECVSEFISFITSEGMASGYSLWMSEADSFDQQLPKNVSRRSGRRSMARISCLP